MGQTANRQYPYPAPSDAPNGPTAFQALAQAIDDDVTAEFAQINYRTGSYAPLIGQNGGPTVKFQEGRYTVLGKRLLGYGLCSVDVPSPSPGVMYINLPNPQRYVSDPWLPLGFFSLAHAGQVYTGNVVRGFIGEGQPQLAVTGSGLSRDLLLGGNFIAAANDRLSVNWNYEVA